MVGAKAILPHVGRHCVEQEGAQDALLERGLVFSIGGEQERCQVVLDAERLHEEGRYDICGEGGV